MGSPPPSSTLRYPFACITSTEKGREEFKDGDVFFRWQNKESGLFDRATIKRLVAATVGVLLMVEGEGSLSVRTFRGKGDQSPKGGRRSRMPKHTSDMGKRFTMVEKKESDLGVKIGVMMHVTPRGFCVLVGEFPRPESIGGCDLPTRALTEKEERGRGLPKQQGLDWREKRGLLALLPSSSSIPHTSSFSLVAIAFPPEEYK